MASRSHKHAIVAICGTNRPGNFTQHAMAIIVDELEQQDVALSLFDAADMDLNFPGHGVSPDAERLVQAVARADGVIFCSPEYHGSVSAMTKLIIENLGFPSALSGKAIALAGVADGAIGAIKSLEQMRSICSHIGAIVLPGSASVAGVQSLFGDQGQCLDPAVERRLRGVPSALLDYLDTLA